MVDWVGAELGRGKANPALPGIEPRRAFCLGLAAQVGGVLCQSSYVDGAFLVTVGVGLNVSNSHPST